MDRRSWLLLLYSLPTESSAERVSLWRKLKKFGAIQFKTSVYVLPDEPQHQERFQWLGKQVRDGGGEATLMQVRKIEGVSDEQIIALFNGERSAEYQEVAKNIKALAEAKKKKTVDAYFAELEKLRRRFEDIRSVDFFSSPASKGAAMLLQQASSRFMKQTALRPQLKRDNYKGKHWLTRPRPEIDRVGSAWLIKRFIDPEATFVFSGDPRDYPDAIPYDMNDVEFTHHGDDCTFETLLRRFRINDKRLRIIGEMIHDADLEDEKFGRSECIGLDRIFKGFGQLALKDEEILSRGFDCFSALYASL